MAAPHNREAGRGAVAVQAARSIARGLGYVVVLAAVALLYLHQRGVPAWLLREILNGVNRGSYALDARALTLDLRRGLVLHDVKLYRKRVMGPPAVEAADAALGVNPWRIWKTLDGINSLRVRKGILRPGQWRGPAEASAATATEGWPASKFSARLELEGCSVAGVTIDRMSCELETGNQSLALKDLDALFSARGMTGTASGQFNYDAVTRTLGAHLETELDPELLVSWLPAGKLDYVRRMLAWSKFSGGAPRCLIDFRQVCSPGGLFSIDARFECNQATYRGVPVVRVDSGVAVTSSESNLIVRVAPLLIEREEGVARVGFSIYPYRKRVEFEAVSGLNPADGFRMIGILTNALHRMFQFNGPVNIQAAGVVDYDTLAQTDFEAKVSGRKAALWGFEADECSFLMRMVGATNTIRNLNGAIYGGTFGGTVQLVFPGEGDGVTRFAVDARASNVEFAEIVGSMVGATGQARPSGEFFGSIQLNGCAGDDYQRTLQGHGKISIENGKVFTLPVFGGLSQWMARIIPGLNFVLRQSDASADFTIGHGAVHSENIRIQGDVLSLTATGDYHLNAQLDYYVQVKLMRENQLVARLIRILTYPISKLFEFRLLGPRNDTKWYPANFSTDLLRRLGIKEKAGNGLTELPTGAPAQP